MTAEAEEQRRRPNLEIAQLIETMQASDSVELKMTVVPDQHRATVASLPIDPVEAQPRQVYFFDTPDLRLNQAGVVVRARRIQGGRGDTVVKLRPVVPAELPRSSASRRPSTSRSTCCPACSGCARRRSRGASRAPTIREAVRGESPSGSCSPRTSARSTRSTPRRSRARRSAGRSGPRSSSSPCSRRRRSPAASSRSCGSTRTAAGSSSCRPSACRTRRSRSRRESPGVPRRARHRSWWRHAADEDQDGPRVLQHPAARGRRGAIRRHRPGREGTDTDGEVLSPDADEAG